MATKRNFEENSNLFLHGKRPNWTTEQQIRLWVRCGGYCTMCPTYLLSHEYFGEKGKFGELAHIIAHSPNGPRPNVNEYPQEYVDSEDNIMILCPTCHSMIDKKENESKYNESILRKWKADHEHKIRNQTKPTLNATRRAIRFCATVGGNRVSITDSQIREALFPNCFVGNERPAEILIALSDDERDDSYWQRAEQELRMQFKSEVAPCIKDGDKLAIFGIAPIPLLMLFGSLLADFNVANIQNLFRDQDNQWAWKEKKSETSNPTFIVNRPKGILTEYSRKVLLLSLTAPIRDRVDDGRSAIWEVMPTVGPHYESIKSRKTLNEFGDIILNLLEEISKAPGDTIHVFSAIPNSAAIMFGTKYMKKANNNLVIYDYISSLNMDKEAIKISSL